MRLNLVSLASLLPTSVIYDLRYATPLNITGTVLDSVENIGKLDMGAAVSLSKSVPHFKDVGVRLVIWDAFRSESTQKALRACDPDAKYVLEKSQHSLGLAVDVTLANEDGTLLDMGTDHDVFSELSYPDSKAVSELQKTNRQFLIDIMKQYGFVVWPYEWWHFDYKPETLPPRMFR
jgi:D-alanyl-D-alanine dipeptidase